MNRLCLQGFEPEHVDAKARVNLGQFECNERSDPLWVPRRTGQPHRDGLYVVIAAMGLKEHAPRTAPLLFKHLAQARQKPVKPGKNILFQPDRVRQGHADCKMIRRLCRGDRFRC